MRMFVLHEEVNMKVTQPKIFVSHATDDDVLISNLFNNLNRAFPSADFFISSRYRSIDPGTIWLTEIVNAIKSANVVLVCLSRTSITRPWIWFEAGGGYCNGKPLIPIVLDDLPFDAIKPPLQAVQAIRVDKQGIIQLVERLEELLQIPSSAEWSVSPFKITASMKKISSLKRSGIYAENKTLSLETGWECYSGDPSTFSAAKGYISLGASFNDGFRYPPTDSLSAHWQCFSFRVKPLGQIWLYAVVKCVDGSVEKIVATNGNSKWGYVASPNDEFAVPLPPIKVNVWSTISIDLTSFEHRIKSPIEKIIGFRIRGPILLSHIWCLENTSDSFGLLMKPDYKIIYPK